MGEVRSLRLPGNSGYVEEEFKAWWNALDPEERIEFELTYGGKIQEARFLYMLDKWIFSGGRWGQPDFGMILEAYAIAYNVPEPIARSRYKEALEHDAVRAIIARLTYRETLSATIRIQQSRFGLIETLLKQAKDVVDGEGGAAENLPLVREAIKASAGLATEAALREAEARAERTRGAMQRARDIAAALGASKEITTDELIVVLRDVRQRVGREGFDKLLRDSEVPGLDSGGRSLPAEPGGSAPG